MIFCHKMIIWNSICFHKRNLDIINRNQDKTNTKIQLIILKKIVFFAKNKKCNKMNICIKVIIKLAIVMMT